MKESTGARVAVVTGGSVGIGAAIVQRLTDDGFVVANIDRQPPGNAAEDVSSLYVEADITDSKSVDTAADKVVAELGGIGVWVNNAGIYPSSPVVDMTDDFWRRVMSVNLDGTFYCARAAAQRMIEAGAGGLIVNITSGASLGARAEGLAAYVSSKHAVAGLTKSLAVELGKHGIRVMAVAPITTSTPGMDELRSGIQGGSEVLDRLAATPLGRSGTASDVADAVSLLASPRASFLTGSSILVDGGKLAF